MRIIDILNKIANKEFDNLPKTIKYKEHIFKLGITQYNYFDETGIYTLNEYIEGQNLNDEVEILETTITYNQDDKDLIEENIMLKNENLELRNKLYNQDNIENNKQDKIEKIDKDDIENCMCIGEQICAEKINEIIDKVNKL